MGASASKRRCRSGTPNSRADRNGGRGFSLLVGPVAGAVLVQLATLLEAVEREVAVQVMRLVMGDGVRKGPARGRRRLEALIAPAAVQIEVPHRRLADERAAIRRHVLDAAPVPKQTHAADERHQRDRAFGDVADLRELAALRIGVETVDMAAEDESAL